MSQYDDMMRLNAALRRGNQGLMEKQALRIPGLSSLGKGLRSLGEGLKNKANKAKRRKEKNEALAHVKWWKGSEKWTPEQLVKNGIISLYSLKQTAAIIGIINIMPIYFKSSPKIFKIKLNLII